MSSPSISVVIPTYNRRALVTEAVDCVLAQTHADLELIVVDDGSTDGTADVLEQHVAGDRRVRILRRRHRGLSRTRNAGIAAARGTWTAFIDSDDLWETGYLASQLACLETHPDADLVIGDAAYLNQGRAAASMFGDPDFRPPTSVAAMCEGAWALPSAMVVRTPVVQALGFAKHYKIVQDTEFLFRFHERGHRLVLNPACLATWRRPEGESAPALTSSTRAVELEMLALFDAKRHLAADPAEVTQRLYKAHRAAAKELIGQGRYRDARPHVRAWCRQRPLRVRLRLYYLRSLLPG